MRESGCEGFADVYKILPPAAVADGNYPMVQGRRCLREPADPTSPGCWWRSPSQCPGQSSIEAFQWQRDTVSEGALHEEDRDSCTTVRLAAIQKVCFPDRVKTPADIEMVCIPQKDVDAKPPAPPLMPSVGAVGSGECIGRTDANDEWMQRCPNRGVSQAICESFEQCVWVGTCWVAQNECAADSTQTGNFKVPYLAHTGDCVPQKLGSADPTDCEDST